MELDLSNPFAALEVRKAKKKKQGESEKKRRGAAKTEHNLRLEQAIFGQRQSNVSDWADDDEWGAESGTQGDAVNGKDPGAHLRDSEEEIDLEEHFGVELGPEDDHEEHEEKEKHETTAEPSAEELALLEEHRKKYHVQPQRKVSKKELKKKEMDDLDDLLADMGIDLTDAQKGTESSSKKKKKRNKEKSNGGATDETTQSTAAAPEETVVEESKEEDEPSSLTPEQIKSKLEKSKSAKKRTTSKKCVEIAAAEAKARSKGKKGKKDSAHYNQAPNH